MAPGRSRLRRLCALFAATTVVLSLSSRTCYVRADDELSLEPPRLPTRGGADSGCLACRAGNCSLAVSGSLPGVYCGDLVVNFQPCCCTFRNACMTTVFSDTCECFDSAEEEELLTTRFYLFVALTMLAWAVLIYDKMCGGPYKVANSSHVLLANSPSAVRTVTASDSEDEADDSHVQVELTVLSSPRATARSSNRNSDADSLNAEPRSAASLGAGASRLVSESTSVSSELPDSSDELAGTATATVRSGVASRDGRVVLPVSFHVTDETTASV